MSAALHLPPPTTEPDPPRAGADMPSRLGRVLNLVRKLIDYGKQLADTLQKIMDSLKANAPAVGQRQVSKSLDANFDRLRSIEQLRDPINGLSVTEGKTD